MRSEFFYKLIVFCLLFFLGSSPSFAKNDQPGPLCYLLKVKAIGANSSPSNLAEVLFKAFPDNEISQEDLSLKLRSVVARLSVDRQKKLTKEEAQRLVAKVVQEFFRHFENLNEELIPNSLIVEIIDDIRTFADVQRWINFFSLPGTKQSEIIARFRSEVVDSEAREYKKTLKKQPILVETLIPFTKTLPERWNDGVRWLDTSGFKQAHPNKYRVEPGVLAEVDHGSELELRALRNLSSRGELILAHGTIGFFNLIPELREASPRPRSVDMISLTQDPKTKQVYFHLRECKWSHVFDASEQIASTIGILTYYFPGIPIKDIEVIGDATATRNSMRYVPEYFPVYAAGKTYLVNINILQ